MSESRTRVLSSGLTHSRSRYFSLYASQRSRLLFVCPSHHTGLCRVVLDSAAHERLDCAASRGRRPTGRAAAGFGSTVADATVLRVCAAKHVWVPSPAAASGRSRPWASIRVFFLDPYPNLRLISESPSESPVIESLWPSLSCMSHLGRSADGIREIISSSHQREERWAKRTAQAGR